VIAALAEQLGRRPAGDDFGSDSVSAIVEALDREYENGETTEALLFALAATHSDFSKEALNQYAQTAISADVSESLEAALRMASSPMAGLGVTAVSPNTQAASIGLEKGDVIVSFDGKTVNRRRQLIGMVRAADPETAVTIEYYRDGELNEAEVYGGYIGVGIMSIGRSAEQ
jgi:PDZ domain-containing secreted protein